MLNGKKESMESDGLLKQAFHPSRECLVKHVSASKFQNMVKEMSLKISLYNLFRRIA